MKDIESKDFEKEVLKAEGKVLVDFNADWCGPCQMMKPILEVFAKENPDVKVIGVNVDANGELAMEYGVSGIPCIVAFENGEELARGVGVQPTSQLAQLVGK